MQEIMMAGIGSATSGERKFIYNGGWRDRNYNVHGQLGKNEQRRNIIIVDYNVGAGGNYNDGGTEEHESHEL